MERNEEEEDDWHSCHMSRMSLETRKTENTEKSPPASLDFGEQKFFWLALLAYNWRLFSGSCKSVSSVPKKRTEHCWVEKKELAVCPLNIEDALPSTSRCTCRLNNVHTYPNTFENHCHMFFRWTLSQIQCSTSRLAAACGVTPGGTGT
jgi:hypothetical protein